MCFDALKYELAVHNVRDGNTGVRLVGMGVDDGGRIDGSVSHQWKGSLVPDFELAVLYIHDNINYSTNQWICPPTLASTPYWRKRAWKALRRFFW